MPRVVVRAAHESDIATVLALWEQARTPFATTLDTPETVRRLLERSPGGLLIAELDGEQAGPVVAVWDSWRGSMYRLAVLPEYRRRGIARTLVEEALVLLRAQGARRVSALVATEDEVACALWRAVGFEPDDVAGRFVRAVEGARHGLLDASP